MVTSFHAAHNRPEIILQLGMKYNIGNYIIDRLRYQYLIKTFHQHKLKGKLLDLGCGKKPYKHLYDQFVDSSIGIDVETTPHLNKYIDKFYDGKTIPFENDSFDVVLCTEVLEHVENPDLFLTEIHRVLKKDGTLILTVPFMQLLHEIPYDFYRYTPFALRSMIKRNQLTLVSITGFSGPFGFFITTSMRLPLKIANKISKATRLKFIYSIYNPVILLLFILPQHLYTLLSQPVKDSRVFTHYTCKGYAVVCRKENQA